MYQPSGTSIMHPAWPRQNKCKLGFVANLFALFFFSILLGYAPGERPSVSEAEVKITAVATIISRWKYLQNKANKLSKHATTLKRAEPNCQLRISQRKNLIEKEPAKCQWFFPTCQVRVVRFYVSCPPPPPPPLFLLLFLLLLFLLVLLLPLHLVVYLLRPCDVPDLNHDLVSSVWRAGPQPRSCEFSVAWRTPTAILWVQCGVPGPNREHVSSVWRAGPQPRSCEFSVACQTSTAILWVQCGVPDLNRDPVSSVWRAGPQVMCQKICQKEWQKICQKEECQKICQKKCQKDMSEDMSERMSKDMSERCQKECQKTCQKECQKICQKECQKICQE